MIDFAVFNNRTLASELLLIIDRNSVYVHYTFAFNISLLINQHYLYLIDKSGLCNAQLKVYKSEYEFWMRSKQKKSGREKDIRILLHTNRSSLTLLTGISLCVCASHSRFYESNKCKINFSIPCL